ncbi:MAG: LysM peptidoglycan-binding domain-containing protein [Desulfobacterales bacterium]|jgi:membrane-bound lytic murein transglycosylase D|nr:LysM peptidoglycan-binding domain-containing protein [Desulfobacterales bacterium]
MHLRRFLTAAGAMAALFAMGCAHEPPDRSPSAFPAAAPAAAPAPKLPAQGPPGTRAAEVPLPKAPAALPAPADRTAVPPGSGEECAVEEEGESQAEATGAEAALNQALALCQQAQQKWQAGDLDQAIGLLDDAYALILEVDPGNDALLTQEKEDLRFTISKRIMEIYSSRRVAVNGQRNAIPLTLNVHVQNEIDAFTVGREREFFAEAYRRSGKYRPKIEAAFKEAGLPPELSWLPLIESGYKVTALSPARALGLWQFIPSTGYRYNLNRDGYIDERMDPEKATQGAIAYLKDLHDMFGDWSTALAAYNCGEHRVMRTIQSQNINYLDDFWDLYERLPRETARYVPRFLATLHIVTAPEKFGLDAVAPEPELAYETVTVPRQVPLQSIAQATGIEAGLLRELNAELRQGVLPENGYELRVPPGSAERVTAKIDDIAPYRPRRVTTIRHTVRKRETIESVARRYGAEVQSLLAANNLRRSQPLAAGQTLRVPLVDCPPGEPPAAAPALVGKRQPIEHTVRAGDSLWNLAQRYHTTTQEIQRLNQLKGTSITVGQTLKIAPAAPAAPARAAAAKPKPVTYAVRRGDTLQGIARSHNMALERLLALNNLTPRTKIIPGQKILVE